MTADLYNYSLIDNSILHLILNIADLNKDNANALYEKYSNEKDLPDFSDFILDATKSKDVENAAIGILMKSLDIMKKAKGYLVLVMTEQLLQKLMVNHPEMFNYLAIFHSADDAVAFIKKSRS